MNSRIFSTFHRLRKADGLKSFAVEPAAVCPADIYSDGRLPCPKDTRRGAPYSEGIYSIVSAVLCGALLLGGAPSVAKADTPKAQVYGTIVAIRGNILVVRPSLRPKLTRVSFGDKTVILAYERTTLSVLKPGMRVSIGGRYSEQEGLHAFWVEAAEKPIGYLAEKSNGLQRQNEWARGIGTIKSVQPFVFTDDAGKEYAVKIDNVNNVWHDFLTDRNGLLIGTRIRAEGAQSPDGVIQADSISPDRNLSRSGTMFGQILGVHGNTLEIRPRYTSDTLRVTFAPNCGLLQQRDIDTDSIKVGDKVTFWGEQRNHPWDMPKSDDLVANALLLGKYHYPAAEGQTGGVFLTGKIASLEPAVRLSLPTGNTINVIIPAQMPIARLEKISAGDLKPGRSAMLVLSRLPDGRFQASTVVLDASPYVGYGG